MKVSENVKVKVWDIFVRSFHWTLVAAFAIAFVTEDDFMRLHVLAGYSIMILLFVRFIWGFIGTRYARFSSFVHSPRVVLNYLKDKLLRRSPRYIGHNPAGGAMIVALFASLILTCVSGLGLLAVEENAGPLAGVLSWGGDRLEDFFETLHEFFTDITVMLIFVHVCGVIFESWLQKENLIRAMWTGFKRNVSESLNGERT